MKIQKYTVTSDPLGDRFWRAKCVSGKEAGDCDAKSPDLDGQQDATNWMAEHTAATGHRNFKRTYTDFAIVEPQ